ncbi:MAG TPA: hypothetical protein VFP65_15955 [Anaeromyxobacteraceae bacterium]|nr:hypothetical protein [Anaeromyxobacteraceae bacterium]
MRHARKVMLSLTALAALTAVAGPRPAHAAVSLGVGASYLLEPEQGEFQLTLAADTPIARHLTVGGRFGAALFTGPDRVGVPIDLRLRARFQRLYVEGLIGPWIVFNEDDALKFHGAVGFGLAARQVSFGLEVGYLTSPSTGMLGVVLAFPL